VLPEALEGSIWRSLREPQWPNWASTTEKTSCTRIDRKLWIHFIPKPLRYYYVRDTQRCQAPKTSGVPIFKLHHI